MSVTDWSGILYILVGAGMDRRLIEFPTKAGSAGDRPVFPTVSKGFRGTLLPLGAPNIPGAESHLNNKLLVFQSFDTSVACFLPNSRRSASTHQEQCVEMPPLGRRWRNVVGGATTSAVQQLAFV